MRKVVVELAMLVRQTKRVIVEVPDDCSATDDQIAQTVWHAAGPWDDEPWTDDPDWWEEGTHTVAPAAEGATADCIVDNQAQRCLVAIPMKKQEVPQ